MTTLDQAIKTYLEARATRDHHRANYQKALGDVDNWLPLVLEADQKYDLALQAMLKAGMEEQP